GHRCVGVGRGRDARGNGRCPLAAGAGAAIDVVADGAGRGAPGQAHGGVAGRGRETPGRVGAGGGGDAGEVVIAGHVVGDDVVLVVRPGSEARIGPLVGAGRGARGRRQGGHLGETPVVDRPQDLVAIGLVAGVVRPADVDLARADAGH